MDGRQNELLELFSPEKKEICKQKRLLITLAKILISLFSLVCFSTSFDIYLCFRVLNKLHEGTKHTFLTSFKKVSSLSAGSHFIAI